MKVGFQRKRHRFEFNATYEHHIYNNIAFAAYENFSDVILRVPLYNFRLYSTDRVL
jgi:hypothetical protein